MTIPNGVSWKLSVSTARRYEQVYLRCWWEENFVKIMDATHVGVGNTYEYILMDMSVSFCTTFVHSYSSLNALWDHSEPRIVNLKALAAPFVCWLMLNK